MDQQRIVLELRRNVENVVTHVLGLYAPSEDAYVREKKSLYSEEVEEGIRVDGPEY